MVKTPQDVWFAEVRNWLSVAPGSMAVNYPDALAFRMKPGDRHGVSWQPLDDFRQSAEIYGQHYDWTRILDGPGPGEINILIQIAGGTRRMLDALGPYEPNSQLGQIECLINQVGHLLGEEN